MTNQSVVEEARQHAERILVSNGGELGLLGSSGAYQQVWGRDSMICGLGLLLCKDSEGANIHKRSLKTLAKHQSPLGNIPHNVGLPNIDDPALIAHGGKMKSEESENQPVVDNTHAGCVDNSLWFIIGHYYNFMMTKDLAFLQESWPAIERALLWLRYQDINECGLLEIHESMDWADLFANRYNVLFDNVLYSAAWRSMSAMSRALGLPHEWYLAQAEDVRMKIDTLLWVGPEAPVDWDFVNMQRQEWQYPIKRVETELVVRPFYLPYMGFRDYADRFDTFGNVASILFGIADQPKADQILEYIHGCGINMPFPIRSLYPVIRQDEKDWRDYYRVRNLNIPNHYHNGGAWPFLGGFYVTSLVQAGHQRAAEYQLERLAEMNRLGKQNEWEFNEWFHGESGRPMGYAGQSWSAAMYIFAHDAVTRGHVNVFNQKNGWARH